MTKHYTLAKAPADTDSPDAPEYHLFLDVQLRNLSDEKQTLAYRLEGPTGLPLEGAGTRPRSAARGARPACAT